MIIHSLHPYIFDQCQSLNEAHLKSVCLCKIYGKYTAVAKMKISQARLAKTLDVLAGMLLWNISAKNPIQHSPRSTFFSKIKKIG